MPVLLWAAAPPSLLQGLPDVLQQAALKFIALGSEWNFKARRGALGQHEIIRRAFGIAGKTEIRPIANDRLALGEGVPAFPGRAAVRIGTVHAGDDHIGLVDGCHVHLEDRARRFASRLVLLWQPNIEALAFEEARQFVIETLFGKRKERAREIELGHSVLPRRHPAPRPREVKESRFVFLPAAT